MEMRLLGEMLLQTLSFTFYSFGQQPGFNSKIVLLTALII